MTIDDTIAKYTREPICEQDLSTAMTDGPDELTRSLAAALGQAADDLTSTESHLLRLITALSASLATVTDNLQATAGELVLAPHPDGEVRGRGAHIDALLARRSCQISHLRQLAGLWRHATHPADETTSPRTEDADTVRTLRTPGIVGTGRLGTEIDADDQGRFDLTAATPHDGQRGDIGNSMDDTLQQAGTVAEASIAADIDDAVAEHWSRFPIARGDVVIYGGELWEVFAVGSDAVIDIGDVTTNDHCDRAPISALWPASPLVTPAQHQQAEALGLRHEQGYRYRSDQGLEVNRLDVDHIAPGQPSWYLIVPAEADVPAGRTLKIFYPVFADALFVARLYLEGRELGQLLEVPQGDDPQPTSTV